MANLTTSADLVNYALFNGGEPTDGSSDYASAIVEYLNRAYRAMWNGGTEFDPELQEDWYWLKKDTPGLLTLVPTIQTGSVSVTNNSASITFSSAPASSVAGFFFKTTLHPDVFRIASHTGGAAAATLDGVYTGTTASAATYQLAKGEYSLASDVLRIISPMRIQAAASDQGEIDGVELSALERDWPLSDIQTGAPTQFAHVTETKVRFNKMGLTDAATSLMRVEYDYLLVPADLANDTNAPLVPLPYRHVLADMTLYFLLIAKNDDRANQTSLQARAGLRAMSRDNRRRMVNYSRSAGQILSRADTRAKLRRPLRTTSGVIIG